MNIRTGIRLNSDMVKKLVILFKYGIVGVLNTAIDFAVFMGLQAVIPVSVIICQVAGYSAGVINSFIMNKIWTFKNKTAASEVPKQFIRFVAVNMVSLAISAFLIRFFNTDLKFSVLLSKVLVTIITLLINFIGYNFLVFKHKTDYLNEKNKAAAFSPDLQK